MKSVRYVLFLVSFLFITVAQGQKYEWKEAKSAGYTYKYVTNDPMKARFYTLRNGLSVILSENHKTPRIGVRIAVRAGSNTDPATHTGLAHYLEHLLFKGTDKFGTLDWEKEKPLLDKIEALYEVYDTTTDTEKRKELYKEIDRISGEASKYSIANEYDKLMSSLGSQGTNAHTWVEETVYHEDIPSESLDKFLLVQAERFRNPIFRLFHTELEAVYEEKNQSIDNDGWKIQEALHYYLFPTHNYGQQSTIGTIEHLKNPSLVAIKEYYNKYYVPNNMSIIMSGDFNPDELIQKIDKGFAYMVPEKLNEYNPAAEKPITKPAVHEVFGPSAESLMLGYRIGASTSKEALMADLISSILSNGKAGLLDLNLNKQQKTLGVSAGVNQYKDYGIFILAGSPKQDQSLEEVRDLIFGQLDLLKKGDFDESMIKAIVDNNQVFQLRAMDNNTYRVNQLMTSFIQTKGNAWDKDVAANDEMLKISKKEIVDFANKFFADNYVLIYKRKGEDKDVVKVEKPPISPVETNAGKESPFVAMINAMPSNPVKPQWLDYNKDLQKGTISNANYLYVQNKNNKLFNLTYYFDLGTYNDPLLSMAASYLSFLGMDNYTAEDISKQFYNIACNFNVSTGSEVTSINLSGLQDNFDKAVSLFENLLLNCKPDQAALDALKSRMIKTRANNKLNKDVLMMGLTSYATYGPKNPFNHVLTDDQINQVTGEQLVSILHDLFKYKHRVLYFGPLTTNQFTTEVEKYHQFPSSYKTVPKAVSFTRVTPPANSVLFADYDMVQSEITWIRNSGLYNPAMEPAIALFNNYFGGGMGSVVFQNIRESKALAYSTYAFFSSPSKKEDPFAVQAYVGSQANKMGDAITAMNDLLNEMPLSDNRFASSKISLSKDLETSRITDFGIITSWLNLQKKGIDYDIRKKIYETIPGLTLDNINTFHKNYIAHMPYTYCVVASKENIDMEELNKIGKVKEVSLQELFGY